MKLRMEKILRFWVNVAYEDRKSHRPDLTKKRLLAELLRQFEQRGDAMRYLNRDGKIGWKPSPSMLLALEDAEREVEQDLADIP
jgi:hypothetical protein